MKPIDVVINPKTIYASLGERQQSEFEFNQMVFGIVFIEKIKPSILRHLICLFSGDNPKYRILDNRCIIPYGGKYYYSKKMLKYKDK